jgi:hypothetical protein
MTYIDLLNDFNQWLESNALPCSSQLMYFRLLNVFNRAGWPEYVQVDNLRMMLMTGVESKTAVIRARNKLMEAGFISYGKGKKGCPCRYYLAKKGSFKKTENATKNDTEFATECATKNDTEFATHIKTKTKTKTNTPVLPDGNTAPKGRMVPPTVDEVAAYCQERGNGLDPETFVDFYASKGWMVGKNPMKDWKAAVRTWERSEGRGTSGAGNRVQPRATEEHGLDKLRRLYEEEFGVE